MDIFTYWYKMASLQATTTSAGLNAEYHCPMDPIDPAFAIKPGTQMLENLKLHTIMVTRFQVFKSNFFQVLQQPLKHHYVTNMLYLHYRM